ncbi:MAG: prolyl-tRNA synthetase associated domain-containing protein [Pseudomonadota bacterium]
MTDGLDDQGDEAALHAKREAEQASAQAAAQEATLNAVLARLGIAVMRFAHPPMHSVEDSRRLRGDMPGLHVKNMFLKDKKGSLVLVTCREDRRFRIADLEKQLGLRRLSFAASDLLMRHLGAMPGAVTPLAVINDRGCAVRLVLDRALRDAEIVNCHPLHNQATVALSPGDLLRIFDETGHVPDWVDFDALELPDA